MRSAIQTLGAALVAGAAAQAGAAVVVDFDGATNAYLTNTSLGAENFQRAQSGAIAGNYDNDANADDSIVGIGFSDTLALNPSTNYNTALPSATFFGGIERIRIDSNNDTTTFDRARVRDSSGTDAISVRYRHQVADANLEYRTAGVFAWNVGPTNIDLTQDASFTTNLGISSIDSVRLVARQGTQWYAGPQVGLALGINAFNYGGSTNNFWKPVDFSTLLNQNTSSGFSKIDLDNVSMVGLYFDDDSVAYNGTAYLSEITVTRFTVDAALVPEPASLSLLAAMGTMALRRRRVG